MMSSPLPPSGVVPLIAEAADPDSNWAVLRVSGADATAFLHSQLSNDIALMRETDARLAAWCNAQGRIIASFVVVRAQKSADSATYWLLCRRDLLAGVVQRLKMFVLRSKVTLEDATPHVAVYGLWGDAAQQHGPAAVVQGDTSDAAAQQHPTAWTACAVAVDSAQRHWVRLYPAALPQTPSVPRCLCIQPRTLPAPAHASATLADWEWSEVCSGVATVQAATSGVFVPQMLNYESTGGIHFQKGCYPGQEVVARSQFRGAIKRRAYVAVAQAGHPPCPLPAAGMLVWCVPAQAPAEQAHVCGTVVQVAVRAGQLALIVCMQSSHVEDVEQGRALLTFGQDAPAGMALQLQPLAYRLVEV